MELNVFEGAIRVVQALGFPTVVACWFMFRTDKKLEELTAAVNNLTQSVKDRRSYKHD